MRKFTIVLLGLTITLTSLFSIAGPLEPHAVATKRAAHAQTSSGEYCYVYKQATANLSAKRNSKKIVVACIPAGKPNMAKPKRYYRTK